jgi:glycerol kinase
LKQKNYILAIDQGTTRTKAILFDRDVRIVAEDFQELTQIYPQPGWVEHNPNGIWEITLKAIRNALNKGNVKPSEIAAIGIANQGETVMVWEKNSGQPIYNAIVWQCRRTEKFCEELAQDAEFSEYIKRNTGLLLDPYFSATKLRWILDNVPDARRRAEGGELFAGTIDSWLVWKLTRGKSFVTDYSTASRTMLFNIHSLQWDEKIAERLQILMNMLVSQNDVGDSSGVCGYSDPDAFDGESIPIAGLLCDQQSALFGQGCFAQGTAKCTYGTGAFLLLNTGQHPLRSKHGLLTSIAWKIGEKVNYFLDGGVYIAGAAINWLRDGIGIIEQPQETERMAMSVSDTGGVYFVPALSGLAAPYWDSAAKGTIVGLTRGTTRSHIVRATLEGSAYRVKDVVTAMENDAELRLQSLRVDGGLTHNAFLMQFQADVLGVPVEVPNMTETTALGVAALAGLAVGFWQSADEIASKITIQQRYEPTMAVTRREELYQQWKRAVECALKFKL